MIANTTKLHLKDHFALAMRWVHLGICEWSTIGLIQILLNFWSSF